MASPRLHRTLLAFGALCRLTQYAARRSIWHDEAFVALNVLQHGYGDLLGRLDWHEPSPPGFLLIEKLAVDAFGRSEYVWRLVPLVAGLATLPLFWQLAREIVGERAATLALGVFAASDKLVAQASEVKHFTLDSLCSLGLSWVALRAWRSAQPRRWLWIFAGLGAVAPWLSFAAVFVFLGTGLVLGWRAAGTWQAADRARYALANALVAVSFALLSAPVRQQIDETVVGFWSASFADLSGIGAFLFWMLRAHIGLFGYFWPPFGVVLLAAASLGLWRWPQREFDRPALALLWLPVLLALGAAFLGRWPYGGNQHMSFAAAPVLALAAHGAVTAFDAQPQSRRRLGLLLGFAVLAPGFALAIGHVAVPRARHEVRPVLEFVARNRLADDELLVFCPAEAELYLGEDFRGPPAAADPARRVWFVATRSANRPFAGQEILDSLAARRPRLAVVEEHGAAAYLFAPEPP